MALGDDLDGYIDALSSALSLPIETSWRPAIAANLKVTLQMARMVEEFPLPDETEAAYVFEP